MKIQVVCHSFAYSSSLSVTFEISVRKNVNFMFVATCQIKYPGSAQSAPPVNFVWLRACPTYIRHESRYTYVNLWTIFGHATNLAIFGTEICVTSRTSDGLGQIFFFLKVAPLIIIRGILAEILASCGPPSSAIRHAAKRLNYLYFLCLSLHFSVMDSDPQLLPGR